MYDNLQIFHNLAPVYLQQCLISLAHHGEPLALHFCFHTCQALAALDPSHLPVFVCFYFVLFCLFVFLKFFSPGLYSSLRLFLFLKTQVKTFLDCPSIPFTNGSFLCVVFSTCFFFMFSILNIYLFLPYYTLSSVKAGLLVISFSCQGLFRPNTIFGI